jgi:hypothetical protein
MRDDPDLSDISGQDAPFGNDGDTPTMAQPVGEAEIEELLYGDGLNVEDRLGRLKALREQLTEQRAGDVADTDSQSLLGEVDLAIARIEGGRGEGMDPVSVDHNPEDHRETLAPDSDEMDELRAEDEEDEAELDEVLDESEWEDGDGFRPERGVH